MQHENQHLHIFFLPHLACGHMIPLLDTAKLLAERGVRATIVTTPGNAYIFHDTIEESARRGLTMQLAFLPFPDVGLPPGCENTSTIPPGSHHMLFEAYPFLRQPFEDLLRRHHPDCVISDSVFLWTANVAESFGIPHVQFNVTSVFASFVIEEIVSQNAHNKVDTSTGTIAPLAGLPHCLLIQRTELPAQFEYPPSHQELTAEAKRKSLGTIYNTFRLLERQYAELMEKERKTRVWCVGPLQLSRSSNSNSNSNGDVTNNWEAIKNWLDSKEPESVVYVSFGAERHFSHEQLREIAIGLDSSGHSFIWVVRGEDDTMSTWMPEGFDERVKGRGLVITAWAPQLLILDHFAVGGSVSNCGWNSAIEMVSTGLPAIAWPLHSEQFLNERLFVEVLKIGVRLIEGGMRVQNGEEKKVVRGEKVREAVTKILGGGEEMKEMRTKAKEYMKLAKVAMEEGGSSRVELSSLFQELTIIAIERRKKAAATTTTTTTTAAAATTTS